MANHPHDIYRTLLENLSDGVMVVDVDGAVRLTNPAFCQIFGLESEQVTGRPFAEIFVAFEGFDEFVEIILDAITEQGEIKRRVASVHTGDEVRSLSVATSYLLTSGTVQTGQVAMIAVVSDITELKELRETELRMAAVVEKQLKELQNAYRDIESRNETLSVMMKKVQAARGVAALLVVGLFLAFGSWYIKPLDVTSADATPALQAGDEVADPGALPTMIVEPREFRSTLALRGNLTPGHIVKVVSSIDSHVREVYVSHGQRVRAGDPLVDLDTGQLLMDYRQVQVEHIRARDKLDEIEDWENSDEMARARRVLRRAKIMLDDAALKLRRTTFLLDEGIVPTSEHEAAQQHQQERKLDFEQAQRELVSARAKGDAEARRVARLEVENAQSRLREHEQKLDQVEIKAPIAGIVVVDGGSADKPLAKGRPVAQGELLLSIADFEQISVASSVDEVDVRKIERGQRAVITGPGFPELELEGTVAQISSRGLNGARQRQTPQFDIVITLDRLDAATRAQLRAGMSAYVTIFVRSNPAALLVPIGAVQQSGDKTWLRVLDPNTDAVEQRPVKLGFTTLDSVEVTAGLAAGEEIVLPER